MRNGLLTLLFILSIGCANSAKKVNQINVKPIQDVQWEKLNPARGDKSPQAGTLWGDRKGAVETGFLVKFVDGFSSPPHIHNVTYRGIVINGLVHNDDPKAANMWMPASSYWTQPAGEPHITSAKGATNVAFIEIDKGPYLVKPLKQAHDNGERPYNIHASNILWMHYKKLSIAPLWKNSKSEINGVLIKFKGDVVFQKLQGKIVTIQGSTHIDSQGLTQVKPGSLIFGKSNQLKLSCNQDPCVVYYKTTGALMKSFFRKNLNVEMI